MARHGYHRTTIAAITRAADLGFGTFYLYFRSKGDILRALVDQAVKRQTTALDDASRLASSPGEALHRVIELSVDAAIENRDLFQIVFEHGGERREPFRRLHQALASALEGAIERGVRSGEFRQVHPALTARAIAGMLPAVLLWAGRSREVSRDTLVAALSQFALRGLTNEEGLS